MVDLYSGARCLTIKLKPNAAAAVSTASAIIIQPRRHRIRKYPCNCIVPSAKLEGAMVVCPDLPRESLSLRIRHFGHLQHPQPLKLSPLTHRRVQVHDEEGERNASRKPQP